MARQGGLGLLKALAIREHPGELAAHFHAAGLAALGHADAAPALRAADEQHAAVEVHVSPLQGHGLPEPDPRAGEAEDERVPLRIRALGRRQQPGQLRRA